MKEIKIKLKRIVEPSEKIGVVKDVDYQYSIDDSTGLIGITLTMYNEIDPLNEFIYHLQDLYKFNIPVDYLVYYRNMKYKLHDGSIQRIRMY